MGRLGEVEPRTGGFLNGSTDIRPLRTVILLLRSVSSVEHQGGREVGGGQ